MFGKKRDLDTGPDFNGVRPRLGEMLVRDGVITRQQLNEALKLQEQTGDRLGEILVQKGYVSIGRIFEYLAQQFKSEQLGNLNRKYEHALRNHPLLTDEQIKKAKLEATIRNDYLIQTVVDMHLMTASDALHLLSEQWRIDSVDLSAEEIDGELVRRFPQAMIMRLMSMPVRIEGETILVGMVNPFDLFAIREIEIKAGSKVRVKPLVTLPRQIKERFDEIYGKKDEEAIYSFLQDIREDEVSEIEEDHEFDDVSDEIELTGAVMEEAQQSYIILLVYKIILQALKEGASDIHIEPFANETALRYRVDGVLRYKQPIPKSFHNAVVSRIKILARLNIAERRNPQDGRISLKMANRKVDLRVSVIPTVFGESVVMRILDKSAAMRSLSELGFLGRNLELFEEAIHKPHGLILISGPTGSGKSTTLFAALNAIKSPEMKILTVEDPVEYDIDGIVQVQAKESVGLTFAKVLRSFLRQDPDVIMVGEMRDSETTSIAIKAALTGHLVFSTIHTNDAPSSVTRLVDIGVEPFLVADSVNLVMAQRLIHTICPKCKVQVEPTETQLRLLEEHNIDTSEINLCVGRGCEACNNTGMKGRTGIHELLVVDDNLKDLIVKGASAYEIKAAARQNGMRTLREDGYEKAIRGITTIEEVNKRAQ